MRRWVLFTAVLALVASACAQDQAVAPKPGEPAASPARGGTLVVAVTEDPGGLNPAITTSGATHAASELFFNGLVALDEQGEPGPELAREWQIEEDGRAYRFHLRDDVTWHDGRPFTSADVKYSFEQVLLKFHARTKASMGPALAGIDAPDAHTVVFRFNEPYAPLLLQLNVTEAPIVPRHLYEGTDPQTNPANNAPVGTGPFRFVSYDKGAEIRAARNENYFKEGLPFFDEIVQRVIKDRSTQVLSLENGEVEFLWNVPGPDQARLREDPEVELGQTPSNPGGSNCIMTITFNLDRPALRPLDVRRAIAHALDRQRFVDQILFGEGQVADAPISSGISWAHARGLDLPQFDRAEAGRLLDAAGWRQEGQGPRVARGVEGVPDGTPLAISFLHFPQFAKYGELVREQLGAVGIGVNLEPLEPAVFAPTVFGADNFDTAVISYCNGPDPEIGVRRMYDSSQIGDVPFTNASHYSNPEVDRLFEQASQTVDRNQRAQLYHRIQEIVVRDLPYMWLVETLGTRAWPAECEGFQPWTGLFAEAAHCRR
ncbi:MAG: ABC transporter substrate-binding protein [Actinomycetota bacterium]|nr:ABC transporter substrate-binding protein [Actinomycetota bacterium]